MGTAQVFANLSKDFHYVAVSGLGQPNLSYNDQEILDECKENIRICAGVGARALQDNVFNISIFHTDSYFLPKIILCKLIQNLSN